MNQTEDLLTRLATEMGGLDAGPIQRVEHEYLPWEKRCHALANILDSHKIFTTEEKRHGIEDLGAEIVEKLSYNERWIVAFANILFQKEMLRPGELARKMDQVQARWPTEAADKHARSAHQ
jgi:hypothetical protein